MIIARIQYYLDGRLFEWTFSGGAFWLGMSTLVWPESITTGAFTQLVSVMSPGVVVAYALAVSIAGFAALLTNGRSLVWGPIVRSVCATGRAYLWSQMAYALFLVGMTRPTPSIGLGFWAVFAVAELYVAFRAMVDVKRNI